MVLVPAPETSTRIAVPKTWMRLKHSLSAARFQHYFRNCNAISLGDVCLKVNVVAAVTYFPELEAVRFEFFERAGTCIYVGLFHETKKCTLTLEHERNPVVAGINPFFFTANAIHFTHSLTTPDRASYRAPPAGGAARYRLTQERNSV